MLENKTPDPNSQPLKVEDILAKAEEIRNARDRQSSVTNSDLGEAFKLFTVVDKESKLLANEKDSFKPVKLFWNWTGFGEKKLLDLVQILFVPVAIAAAGIWFQDNIKGREESSAKIKTVEELKVADSKAKQETLTKYLDQMSDLLEKGLLKSKQDSPMFIIAQSKTVTALQSLDTERQRLLIQFFKSANLNTLDGGKGLLFKARMSKAQLQGIDLSEINLKEVDLSGSNLNKSNLIGADLSGSNLGGANIRRAYLEKANFNGVDLNEANLKRSDLSRASFTNALMRYTNMSNVTNLNKEQLEKASSPLICATILPGHIKINDKRDCAAMPQILLKRYPLMLKKLEEAVDFMNREAGGELGSEEDDDAMDKAMDKEDETMDKNATKTEDK
jgi:uncharacterized protein YjbI with pentapeptide repeats